MTLLSAILFREDVLLIKHLVAGGRQTGEELYNFGYLCITFSRFLGLIFFEMNRLISFSLTSLFNLVSQKGGGFFGSTRSKVALLILFFLRGDTYL